MRRLEAFEKELTVKMDLNFHKHKASEQKLIEVTLSDNEYDNKTQEVKVKAKQQMTKVRKYPP